MTKPAETISVSRSDGELLTEFVARRDEPAFAEIVRRHGGMVISACRSVLGNTQDAEDAAQAVFLTLAQRASSLTNRTTLVGWLYRVAWHVAARAAEARAIRRRHEQEAARMNPNDLTPQDQAIPLEMLHTALAGLPEKYRLPLLLHHLEGRSEEETAHLLGCSLSATSMRLTRGRQLLRTRLAKHGVAASAVGLVAVMATEASAGVTPPFVTTASQLAMAVLAGKTATAVASASVAAFSKGAMNMLFWAEMKLAAMAAAATLLVGGAGVATYVVAAGNPASPSTTAPATTATAKSPTTTPAPANENDSPWGAAVEGVQVRLRARGLANWREKLRWKAGETPTLLADVRFNQGTRDLHWRVVHRPVELEIDGLWYHMTTDEALVQQAGFRIGEGVHRYCLHAGCFLAGRARRHRTCSSSLQATTRSGWRLRLHRPRSGKRSSAPSATWSRSKSCRPTPRRSRKTDTPRRSLNNGRPMHGRTGRFPAR